MKKLKIQSSKNSKTKNLTKLFGGGYDKGIIRLQGENMKNFNSFNTQPECLEKKDDMFNNLTYDKTGISLDNLVDDLRNGYGERSFVATADAYRDTLQQRLIGAGDYVRSISQEPISSVLKLDNGNYIVTHAVFMGLVKTNKEGKAQLEDVIDMHDKDEDFNPYKGFTIGQPTDKGNTPVALTVFNRGNRVVTDTRDNTDYLKFREGLSRQIIDYYTR